MRGRLIAVAAVAAALAASGHAQTLQFSYVEPGGISFAFSQSSTPTPLTYHPGEDTNVAVRYLAGNVTSFSTLDWYSTASLGMFSTPDGQNLIYGPQVYTGTEQHPVFAPGVFTGADQSSGLTGTLTVLTLPQIVNGSFEASIAPGKSALLLAGDTRSLRGWTVGGTVDIVGTAWVASDGARSVDLSGITPGDISQTVGGLIAGVTYRLTFDLSGSYDSIRTSANHLDVSATANAAQLYTFDKNNTVVDMMYDHLFYDFTATGSSSVIDFAGLDEGDYGAVLDNVAIGLPPQAMVQSLLAVRSAALGAVPEPASWAMMIGGFGMIGAAQRRLGRRAGRRRAT